MYLEKSHVLKACHSVDRLCEKFYQQKDASSKMPLPGDALWLMLEGSIATLVAIADNAEEVQDWFDNVPMSVDLLKKIEAYEEMI